MLIEIDFNSDHAIYMQLRNQILLMIARNELQDGSMLPSVRQLASDIGVNMHTVNKAYAILREEGYLQLDKRKGTIVCMDCNKQMHLQSMCGDVELLVAEAICNDISLEELQDLIQNMYHNMKGQVEP